MKKMLGFFLMAVPLALFGQTNQWSAQYVTLDDATHGTSAQTASVAAVGANNFVALVTETPGADIFDPPGNYLVGYWQADSVNGRVTTPMTYGGGFGEFTAWESGLDKVNLKGAWQIAGGANNYVYVANNDVEHNILVFELTSSGVTPTDFRMVTGSENILAIEVDALGNVYVVDRDGSDSKTDEVKVFAGINTAGTTWGDFGGHNDSPTATIDLPPGSYGGITASSDGSMLFVSASSARSIWKYVGSPATGYTRDTSFDFTLSPDDTIGFGGSGTPEPLGLAFVDDPPTVFAAVDTFLFRGVSGGYPYGRIYEIDALTAVNEDTIDVAQWNEALTGDFSSGSGNGRAGGFTSTYDVDVEPSEAAIYSETYFGWAVEKWIFDGVVSVEQASDLTPERFSLRQNYPNPFNPTTTIEFSLKQSAFARLEVFNLLGQKVGTLLEKQLAAGSYKANFDAGTLNSGVYFYKLTAGDFTSIKKMLLTK